MPVPIPHPQQSTDRSPAPPHGRPAPRQGLPRQLPQPIPALEALRLYEERIEEEYAKREGGA